MLETITYLYSCSLLGYIQIRDFLLFCNERLRIVRVLLMYGIMK